MPDGVATSSRPTRFLHSAIAASAFATRSALYKGPGDWLQAARPRRKASPSARERMSRRSSHERVLESPRGQRARGLGQFLARHLVARQVREHPGRRLSDFILAEGLISPDQFTLVLAEQKKTNDKLANIVVRLGLLSEEQMMHAQSLHYRIPSVKFPESVPAEILRLVPGAIARKHEVLPIGRSAGALTLAVVPPTNLAAG